MKTFTVRTKYMDISRISETQAFDTQDEASDFARALLEDHEYPSQTRWDFADIKDEERENGIIDRIWVYESNNMTSPVGIIEMKKVA